MMVWFKCSALKKDVHLKEYKRFPHGLWSFATSYGIEECKYAVSDAAAWLKELAAKHEELLQDQLKIMSGVENELLQAVSI